MKSPAELAEKLARQWSRAHYREARLFNADAWPVRLNIGKPSAQQVREHLAEVRCHLQSWRAVRIGEVVWREVKYRTMAEPVRMPVSWKIRNVNEWIDATGNRSVSADFEVLNNLMGRTETRFHPALVRAKQLVLDTGLEEVCRISKIAAAMEPGMALGEPLRALSIAGSDTKFLERHRRLLTLLLDCRYDGEVSEQGLENFLDAAADGDHWIMVCPLSRNLLPFTQQRVRTSEIATTPLPGTHLLVVENETCRYQLPELDGAVAVLGAGLNLAWLEADWIKDKHIGYWGDIDTWGLRMLAMARLRQPDLVSLMMDEATFARFEAATVAEAQAALLPDDAPMTADEQHLFQRLARTGKNRLEQEFISRDYAQQQLRAWFSATSRKEASFG